MSKDIVIKDEDVEILDKAVKEAKKALKDMGIDIEPIIKDAEVRLAEKKSKLLPSIPEELRDDAIAVLTQARGVFTMSNIGQAHQRDIPEFEPFLCNTCDTELDMSNAVWITMGDREYLRVICPNCKTKIAPPDIPLDKTERLNEEEPSIKEAMTRAGLRDREEIEDIDSEEV